MAVCAIALRAFAHSEHRTYNARTRCGTAFVVPDLSFAVARSIVRQPPGTRLAGLDAGNRHHPRHHTDGALAPVSAPERALIAIQPAPVGRRGQMSGRLS